jgi:hypothetical protein
VPVKDKDLVRWDAAREVVAEYGGGGVTRVAVDVLPRLLGKEYVDEASE